jgi:hypothetical protein
MLGWSIALTIVALCAVALVITIRKTRAMKGDVDDARAAFRQQVGYEYVSALTRKATEHGRRKDTPDGVLTHYFEVYSEAGATVTAQAWRLESPQQRTSFQLVEKKLVSTSRAFLNLVGPFQRTVTVSYPGPYPMGDADLDARFALYANDAASARAIVRQPELRSAVLELASVTLLVDESGAIFCDPTDANVYAWGASRMQLNPAPAIRSAAKVHVAVERLLRRIVGGDPDSR